MSFDFIEALRSSLAQYSDKVCAVDLAVLGSGNVRELTYGELEKRALNLAVNLQRCFFQTSHSHRAVVGIVTRNCIDWLIADLACLFAGMTSLPLPLAFSRSQAEHLADRCDGFLVDPFGQQIIEERWSLKMPSEKVWCIDNAPLEKTLLPVPGVDHDWTCKIIHTSGTTSRPKGVCLRRSAISQVLASLRKEMPSSVHRNYLSLVPLSLLLEQITGAYLPLLSGGTIKFLPQSEMLLGESRASPARLLEWILHLQPSALTVPPVMINHFYEKLSCNDADGKRLARYLRSSVHITCGGAAVSVDVLNALSQRGISVFQGYGLSENTSVVSMNTIEQQRIGSVGKPLPHVQVRIGVDHTIEIKSSSLFCGYSGKDPSSCVMTRDGWMDTGDLGELDSEGFLYVHGRKKNIICLPSGRNVSPEQIELEYRQYPGVHDAVVFLDEHHRLIGLLCLKNMPDRAELIAWSARCFSDFERPDRLWLVSLDEPKLKELYTVTGRPKRVEIADAYAEKFPINQLASLSHDLILLSV
ncbi:MULTISPECIES: AMP-binding protein [unclassified Pseudomonas]|uniref:AMP-binding protein n=1 Tax=unclassified Pseudomonas TaxID=196821 RepID=UPI002B22AD15|nr:MULTISPECIES: AMP-binding protein [unclassified Pseudomonas]MEA9979789.1 AMP-binding protein [Pseudomonas sp. RTS4]MEB0199998.1 AMP-binding protein [Pseudomonas sp. 5S4]MEB0248426.1 AMP-binding protein [Pseudomonas sp. 10S5]